MFHTRCLSDHVKRMNALMIISFRIWNLFDGLGRIRDLGIYIYIYIHIYIYIYIQIDSTQIILHCILSQPLLIQMHFRDHTSNRHEHLYPQNYSISPSIDPSTIVFLREGS